MTTTSQNRPWVLKILVHAPDHDVFCVARLRILHGQTIAHGRTANQASISLSITTNLANSSSGSQVLTLMIPPERVKNCGLARRSNNSLCPPRLLSSLPAPVANISAVSTLSLTLDTVGIVLSPSGMDSLIPASLGDLEFHSFAKICQSTFLRLHFSERQLVNDDLDKLQDLSYDLRQRSLQAVPLNAARHGVCQKDWRIFALSPDPPPYCPEPESEQVDTPIYHEQVVGKRRRDPRSMSPNGEGRKILRLSSSQPIGSPTEVNTPSIRTPSRSPSSIRPTHFRRTSLPGQTEYQRLAPLKHELRGVSDDLVCRLLIESGHKHLLAIPKDVHRRLARGLEPISSSLEADMVMVERRLKQYVDETIECRLTQHIDRTVTECRDEVYDLYTQKEAELQEQIDDSNVEVRNTADECIGEIEQHVQGYMDRIEEQAQRCMEDIKDQETEIKLKISTKRALRPQSNPSTQPLLDRKSSARHGLGARIRHSSV